MSLLTHIMAELPVSTQRHNIAIKIVDGKPLTKAVLIHEKHVPVATYDPNTKKKQ